MLTPVLEDAACMFSVWSSVLTVTQVPPETSRGGLLRPEGGPITRSPKKQCFLQAQRLHLGWWRVLDAFFGRPENI